VIYTDEPPRRLLEAVREGHLLGLLPDQNLRTPNGVFVEFFGRLAYTTTLPVNLVRSTKKPMVLVLLAREGEGFRLVVRQIAMTWTGDRREDFLRNTQAWSSALEEEIRKAPGQWMWIHDRWRTQPGDERRMVRVRWSRKARRRRRKAMELGTQGAGDSRPTAE
jgi:KDO2-lipid IV(A) lauroyltransferase